MDSVKSKRFSFAGFSSGLSRSLSFSNYSKSTKKEDSSEVISTTVQKNVEEEEEERRLRRAKKSKSLYIKSFNNTKKTTEGNTTYDVSEATQSNSKEIRNTIRRSLSAVLYASPHSTHEDKGSSNKLVPVLVTPGLSESVGGILIDDGTKNKVKEDIGETSGDKKSKPKKKSVEYDNSLQVIKDELSTTIIWQGYGYTITKEEQEEVASELMTVDELSFEKEMWESYRGLIHPLHLFKEGEDVLNRGRWAGLSVSELRRYYDNYGSMMLKIRETRMLEQQKNYQTLGQVKNEWIIPEIINNQQQQQQQDITV